MSDSTRDHPTRDHPTFALPSGYRLQEYEIQRVLTVGGFGITYLCFDHNLDQVRTLKEYLPQAFAERMPDNTVRAKTPDAKDEFDSGLRGFLEEARTLAKFKHENIIKVYRSFTELGTGYLVMEHAEGQTLSSVLDRKGVLTERELKAVLLPILDGLEEVHKTLVHRNIKPGNIIIRAADGSPVLLDFGSARQAASDKGKALVSTSFTPIEQYSAQGNQGPWTDIYALGCLCYLALAGEAPREAPLRLRNDPTVPISTLCQGKADAQFLAAIDWAMKAYEEERPQSVGAWRAALVGGVAPQTAPPFVREAAPHAANVHGGYAAPAVMSASRPSYVLPGLLAGIVVMTLGAIFVPGMIEGTDDADTPAPAATTTAARVAPRMTTTDVAPSAPRPAAALVEPETPPAEEPEPEAEAPAPPPRETRPAPARPAPTDVIANATPQPDILVAGLNFRDQLKTGDLGPMMVTVPAGSFEMGNSSDGAAADEKPAHRVTIAAPFALSKYEVTFEDYDRFVADTGWANPDDEGWGRGKQPVLNVSWGDAVAYAGWLTEHTGAIYRLPSEAEWEYAARAGSNSTYAWGDDVDADIANCAGCKEGDDYAPAPVGSFPINAFGLYDMQGNVWEWVEDCARNSYLAAPSDGGVWAASEDDCSRVLRGGSWASSPDELRSAYRNWYPPGDLDNTTGIRLVREIRQ